MVAAREHDRTWPAGYVVCMTLLSLALCCLFISGVMRHGMRKTLFKPLILVELGQPPTLSLPTGKRWHLFLSHIWSSGQDQIQMIKRELQHLLVDVRIFLDTDDLAELAKLEEYVDASALMLLFLSQGYFSSKACYRELKQTVVKDIPFTIVRETAVMHGGGRLDEFAKQCPEDLRLALFGKGVPDIGWYRPLEYRLESLQATMQDT